MQKMLHNIIALHTAPKTISIVEHELAHPPQGYVCVQYDYCAICGGDYSVYLGRRNSYPFTLGHEFVATVINVGRDVQQIHKNDIVVSDFNFRCGNCEPCRQEKSHLCIENDTQLFSNRGFALYGNIHESYLLRIAPPDYLPRACLIEPLSCVLHACEQMKLDRKSRVLLCGCGSIGTLFCFYLTRILQCASVTVKEINQHKLFKVSKHFPISTFQHGRNDCYDYIIDCSNSVDGVRFSLSFAKPGSKVCIMSHLYGLDTSFIYEKICKKELVCIFPLRNGKKTNLSLASTYIQQYWTAYDDRLIQIYDDIHAAFSNKATDSHSKQIIRLSSLASKLK